LLLDFETYETQFIKYLIEEKNVPPIPKVFNPYSSQRGIT